MAEDQRAKYLTELRVAQFISPKVSPTHPVPPGIKLWASQPAMPRDMSWGSVETRDEALQHVWHGDVIVYAGDEPVRVIRHKDLARALGGDLTTPLTEDEVTVFMTEYSNPHRTLGDKIRRSFATVMRDRTNGRA